VKISSSNELPSSQRFDCSATTNGATEKQMPQLNSARQIGPEITFQGILIVVEGGGIRGRINAAGIHSQIHPEPPPRLQTQSGKLDHHLKRSIDASKHFEIQMLSQSPGQP
jgi:pyruvate carboxylase